MITSLSLVLSLCAEGVGVCCITDLDPNDIFGVNFDLFVKLVRVDHVDLMQQKMDSFETQGSNMYGCTFVKSDKY